MRTSETMETREPVEEKIVTGRTQAILENEKTPQKVLIKKVLPELRKPKPRYRAERSWLRRMGLRLREDSQFLRSTMQFSFATLCLWIGLEFVLFVRWGSSGGTLPFFNRPPGVDGFLPISGLMSVAYWLNTGVINLIHPSGLFILLAIVLASLVVKKAFCSWFCPIGTLSESLWMLGQRVFKRNLALPIWIDVPLRSLKYLLLGFFLCSIGKMSTNDLGAFIYSPYNKMADVKMYAFFADITHTALYILGGLVILSLLVKNFWCRFLCPYGALLGIMGWFSPMKITRTKSHCIDCMLCTTACPSNIAVHKAGRVWSDECTSCMACVQVCPVKETLEMRIRPTSHRIPAWVVGTLFVGVFVAITGAAMLAGVWQNSIDKNEYLRRFKTLESPIYQHFQGHVPAYGPND